jgi:hypothetical protein
MMGKDIVFLPRLVLEDFVLYELKISVREISSSNPWGFGFEQVLCMISIPMHVIQYSPRVFRKPRRKFHGVKRPVSHRGHGAPRCMFIANTQEGSPYLKESLPMKPTVCPCQ